MTYRAEHIPWGTEVDMPSAQSKRRKKTPAKQSYNTLQAVVKKLPGQYRSITRKDFSNPAAKHDTRRQPSLPKPVNQNPATRDRIIVNKFPLTTGIVILSEAQDSFKLSTSILGAKEDKEVNYEAQQEYSKNLSSPPKHKDSTINVPNVSSVAGETKGRTVKSAVPKFSRPGLKIGNSTSGKLIPPSAKSKKRLDAALQKAQADRDCAKISRAERIKEYDEKIREQRQQERKQKIHTTATKQKTKELLLSQSVPSLSLPYSSTIRQQQVPQNRPISSNRNTSRILTQRLGIINEQLSGTLSGTENKFEKNSDSFKAWQAKKAGNSSTSAFSSTAGSVVAIGTCRNSDSRKSSCRYVKMPRPF